MTVDQTAGEPAEYIHRVDMPAHLFSRGSRVDGLVIEHSALANAIASLSVTLKSLREIDAAFSLSMPLAPHGNGASAIESPHGPPTVQVHCLGAFEVRMNGKPIDTWRAVKPRALFQYLVSHRQRPVAREALIDALWPDPDTAPAGTALKVVVHRVRKLLRESAKHLEIHATEDGYRLDGPDLWVDVEEFERLCLDGRHFEIEGRLDAAAASFASAAALYRGGFLEDVPDEWVVLRRERLKDLYLLALARLTDAALASHDFEQCIERCQQILAHDPCREQAYRVLMVCYARQGQRSRVQRWYDVCVQTLRTELDVEPDSDTRTIYQQAMAGEVADMAVLSQLRRVTRP